MVDTGFSGFLLMPILEAFPVGLILRGTMDVVLADGSTQTKLTCLGEVTFDGDSQIGLIVIESRNAQILVGMEFLRKFSKKLVIDPKNESVEIADSFIA